ncbi:MAG: hypothetical protein MUC52_00140 [Candidatus Omnitrophica bacterium]|nr:hypothetical protein [Candidatus Omnitrophota bacterium]
MRGSFIGTITGAGLMFFTAMSAFMPAAMAADITLLYTGETHAMLYPCNCPIETDGGIARRATLVKNLRKSNPNVLLLDSGAFFAGGLMDEYTQSVELDMARTGIAFKAMAMMKYDAAALGDEEFNFGTKFLEDALRSSSVPVLSANADSKNVKPFIIKEIAGVRVGIIGLTPPSAGVKSGGLTISDPKPALARAISDVKARGSDIIVLLSHLGEAADLELIKDIEGVDVLIIGNGRSRQEPYSIAGKTLILRPSWQGRRIGKAVLNIKDRRVADYTVEEIRLSDSIADDKEILSQEPQCFMDSNCKKGPRKGICLNPGQKNASCKFAEDVYVPLTVIEPKSCPTCQVDGLLDSYKSSFPGLVVTRMSYPDKKSDAFIKESGLSTLPAYLFGSEIEKDPNFAEIKDRFEQKGGFFILKPQFSGVAYFIGRKQVSNRVDVFLSLFDPNITMLLDTLEEFSPQLHFLAARQEDGQLAAFKGRAELEEMKRCVCVKKYHPAYFWNYLNCRVRNMDSSWWQDCLGDFDPAPIQACAKGKEGEGLLTENIALNEELHIASSPTYVVNNQYIFSSKQPPTKQEFRKIFSFK